MRIGFDAKRAFYNSTGLGNFSRTLIASLHTFFPDHKYVLFTPGRGKYFASVAGWPHVEIVMPDRVMRCFPWYWRSYLLRDQLRRRQIDLFHGLSNELPLGRPGPGQRWIVTIHDLLFLKNPNWYPWFDRRVYLRKSMHACRVATYVHAISHQTARDVMELLHTDAERIKVIYQAIDGRYFEPMEQSQVVSVRQRHSLPNEFVLFVGTLERRKNAEAILRALLQMPSSDRLPVVLVGRKTAYFHRMRRAFAREWDSLYIHCIEQTDVHELVALYRSARLLVYPSLAEGFGLPVAEALACGLPVVANAIGVLREAGGPHTMYVDAQDAGLLGEAILRVASDESLRLRMISEGKIYAHQFMPQSVAHRLMALYQSTEPHCC